jgi:hypothetical protein
MQAILRFRVLLAGGFAVAAALLFATSAPAQAADGPPVVGCITGSSCMIELNYYVTYSGNSGGGNGVVVTPPPCLAVPVGDAHTGSQIIISLYGTTAPAPAPTTASATPAPPATTATSTTSATATGTASATPTPSDSTAASATPAPPPAAPDLTAQQKQILALAETLVKSNPITPGEWYQIAGDPYATAAASQVCANLPPYVWAANGVLPVLHGLHIPTRTLAELAYSQLTTPTLSTLKLNPKTTSDTNLPTFVDAVINPPVLNVVPKRLGLLALTTQGNPYVYATAATPDGTAATVYAVATGLTIDSGTTSSNATTWDVSQCSVAQPDGTNNDKYILGSRDVRNAGSYGAGQPIDCGVTYTAPGSFGLTVSVGWTACWAPGTVAAGGPPADCNTNIPGAGGLQGSSVGPVTVNVREIQSVNNS